MLEATAAYISQVRRQIQENGDSSMNTPESQSSSQSQPVKGTGQPGVVGMPQPGTSQLQPWTSFPQFEYSFIEDGFAHQTKFALKTHLQNPRGGAHIQQRIKETKSGKHIHDETKFWIGLPHKQSFYARFCSHDKLKLHYDNGPSKLFNRRVNIYTALSVPHNLSNPSWRVGLSHNSDKVHLDCRIKVNTTKEGCSGMFSTRILWTHGKATCGMVGMVDLNNWVLTCSNLLLAYKFNSKTDIFLRANHEHFRRRNPEGWQGWFDNFILDGVTKYGPKTTVAAEIVLQPKQHLFKYAQLVLQREIKPDLISKFKLKASRSSYELSATARFPVFSGQKQAKIAIGMHAINLHRRGGHFCWGSELEFNL